MYKSGLVVQWLHNQSLITTFYNEVCKHFPVLSSFMAYHRVCNQINMMDAGTVHPSGALEFTPGFQWGWCYLIFSFMCNVLSFFFWPLCCLSFDLRILIIPLVSSNSSSDLLDTYKLFLTNFNKHNIFDMFCSKWSLFLKTSNISTRV